MKLPVLLDKRPVQIALACLAAGLIGAMLIATIYWTEFDARWVMFLGGVLFAAVVALASTTAQAQWIIARRTVQLNRLREQLNREIARSRSALEAMRISEARLRLVSDALPSLILFVDRDERCHYPNSAMEKKTGLSAEQITGQRLRDVVGPAVYAAIVPHIAPALAGKSVDYELVWDSPGETDPTFTARHVPYAPGNGTPQGFYLLLTRIAPAAAASAAAAAREAAAPEAEGEALYLRSIADELLGWDDPRTKLERALRENQFLLYAQKILPLRTGLPEPLVFEILLRLQEEEENLLPPGGFLPVAERYGMMEALDRWVVRNLMLWCVTRQKADPAWRLPLYCVNLSEASLRSAEFARFVEEELKRTGYPARALAFEIGEPDAVNHHAETRRLIQTLKPSGCRFTLDAFGSTRVSFSHLKGLAIDFIKIDGVIVQNMLRDPSELAKVRAINTVCRKTGLHTIAEFVETRETLDRLRETGTDYVQGFGVARPGPIAAQ
ncbi:MAG TPA: EAL domain-containing protein [Burkholderiales bacterium]|nr:EAL domain-containing protein [Burkholderiales bacterium]